MKPIIIYQESMEKDKIIMSKDEFERYINEAYEQGKADGNTGLYKFDKVEFGYPGISTTGYKYPIKPEKTCGGTVAI